MAWYWIVLIVLAALFGLLFLAYMTNADMKLIEKIYNALIAYHDDKDVGVHFGRALGGDPPKATTRRGGQGPPRLLRLRILPQNPDTEQHSGRLPC